jgi:hypothetical protein
MLDELARENDIKALVWERERPAGIMDQET